jgi:serine/threonine-protein kinase RsbW
LLGSAPGYPPTMTIVDSLESVVRVAVPARADMLHLLRSVAASVGARMSMPLDDVEELKIAVDEAATLMLGRMGSTAGSLELALTLTDGSLRVELCLEAADVPAGTDASEADLLASWPWRVIAGMTEKASIERSETGITITFMKAVVGSQR